MANYSDERLAPRLRLLLADRQITIKEAARAVGVPYRTLQNQLAGNNKMPASTFAKLVTMLDVPARFVAEGRMQLDRRSLAEALKTALGDLLPHVDQEYRFHAPVQQSARTAEQLDRDALAVAFVISESYEMRHGFLRFPSHEVEK